MFALTNLIDLFPRRAANVNADHCRACNRNDGHCSLEDHGLDSDEIRYFQRKVDEHDFPAINKFIKDLTYTYFRETAVTVPMWRQTALARVRMREISSMLHDLAAHVEKLTEL